MLCHKQSVQMLSTVSELELRSKRKHCSECDLLQGPLFDHYSKTYGINRRASLLDVSHFPMFHGGLAHDAMHDILEGLAPLEMLLLLRHCIIEEGYLDLDDFNHRLINFDYDFTEVSKPHRLGHAPS